ncbi:helix-turn-helix transcriptional regulator [Chitinophaga sp. OAE865]|uniref:helix-turn-helix transcriptional regulator n=1 Tax=Chitinophaga sp. OAE865 TaxID=2817898 RepID=UPI001AE9AAF9
MSAILQNNELLWVSYNEKEDLMHNRFVQCQSTEDFMRGISLFKEVFERIFPSGILWDSSDFHFVIPPDLQRWVYGFLDKPASDTGMEFNVGHVVSPDVFALVSVMEIYSKNDPLSYRPRYFSHINQAMQCMTLPQHHPDDVNMQVDKNCEDNRARIILDVSIDLLPDYLHEFRRMFENRAFLVEKMHLYAALSKREKEILSLITKHYSNQEIADKYTITLNTAKTHRKNIIYKLRCENNAELMYYQVFG